MTSTNEAHHSISNIENPNILQTHLTALTKLVESHAQSLGISQEIGILPQIPPQDGLALRRYADYLVQCEKAMERVDSLKVLNDDQEIHKMSSKLPKWALTRWGRKVYALKNEKKRFPPFSEFVKYVVVETDIACNPMNLSQRKTEIYSRGPRRQRDYGNFRRTPRESNRDEFARSLATKVNEEDASKGKTEEVQCAMCGKAHELESCKNYMDMEAKERKEFAKTKGHCFECLGKGHLSRDCKRRKKCDSSNIPAWRPERESKETEPSRTENQTEQRAAYCTKSGTSKEERDGIVSSMIIPVLFATCKSSRKCRARIRPPRRSV